MDSLLEQVNDGIGLGVAFADDLACLIAGHDLGSLVLCMQTKVNAAINWGTTNGLELLKEKTEYCVFKKTGTKN